MTTDVSEIRQGQCLCGAVSFSASVPNDGVQMCHCKQCQRWTGGGPLSVVRVKDLDLRGEASINTYHASAHGERAFCQTCGSTLYWKLQGRAVAFMPVGLLEDQSGLTVREEIFVDQRPDWLPAYPNAKQSTEAEMHAQLAAYLESQTS